MIVFNTMMEKYKYSDNGLLNDPYGIDSVRYFLQDQKLSQEHVYALEAKSKFRKL